MNIKLLVAAFLALAVVATGAAAAAPGNAPGNAPTDDQRAGAAVHASNDTATAAQDQDRDQLQVHQTDRDPAGTAQQARDGQRGPPADRPSQVPDLVGQIHDQIRQHISGSLDGILGQELSAVTPGNLTEAPGPATAA
jgi:hypothetical protein